MRRVLFGFKMDLLSLDAEWDEKKQAEASQIDRWNIRKNGDK